MTNKKIKIKGILFDLDGTLVDSKPAYIEAAKITFSKLGLSPISDSEAIAIPRKIEQKQPLNLNIETKPSTFLALYLRSYYSISEQKTKLISNVSKTLNSLSKKMSLSLVTMRFVPKQSLINELKKFNIAEYFDPIVTAIDTCKPKPSPEALLKCVNSMNLNVKDCIIVGDSVNDIKAGRAANMKTVSVLSGIYSLQELVKEKPDFIIPNISFLPDFIE